MRKLFVKLLISTILGVPVAGICIAADLIGEQAPDFALRSTSGKNFRLSEFRSEVVVLTFWSDWCGKCRSALPILDSVYNQYKFDGLQMLAVDVDGDLAAAGEFATENGIVYPVLADSDQSVSRAYDLKQMPLSVVLDREGRVRYVHAGLGKSDGQILATQVAELLAE